MIENDIIWSIISNSLLEPELYAAVVTYQIHTCNQKCQGPAPLDQTCKKDFPRPYSETTHFEEENSRYIYKCLTQANLWVVSYHLAILLLWNAHINAQYITDLKFARYIIKYVVKRKLSHIFNIHDSDILREHVIAWRLGSIEFMFLFLGHQICTSSATVKFLTTEPSSTRTYTILPSYMIHKDDENSYYDDTITKYMSRSYYS